MNGEIVAGCVCHTGWVGLCEKGAQETPERHTDRTQRHTHGGTTLSKGFRTNQNTISSYEELYRQRNGLKRQRLVQKKDSSLRFEGFLSPISILLSLNSKIS